MESIARVNPKYFAAINLFAAKNDIRYYLNGVYIEPHPEKGVVIVGTNGDFIGVIHDPHGFTDRPIIVGNISKGLISACTTNGTKAAKNKPTTLYICADVPYGDGGAVVQSGDTCTGDVDPFSTFTTHLSKIQIIDGKYPDWRKILPAKRERSEIFPCVQPKYLAVFDAVASLLLPESKYERGMYLENRGAAQSVVVRLGDPGSDIHDRFVGLVMPMRGESPETILPSWLMPKDEQQADQATV